MASSLLPNQHESNLNQPREPKRKKRRKIGPEFEDPNCTTRKRWRTQYEQRTYSAKLCEALRHVRRSSSPPGVRPVKEAADRVLAIAARGRTRWSRAILRSRLRLRSRHKKASLKAAAAGCSDDVRIRRTRERERERAVLMKKKNGRLPESLNRRLRVLGGLVPGCRKLSFSNLVEETADYIAALEMQVRAMAELAELLSGAGSSAQPSSPC